MVTSSNDYDPQVLVEIASLLINLPHLRAILHRKHLVLKQEPQVPDFMPAQTVRIMHVVYHTPLQT